MIIKPHLHAGFRCDKRGCEAEIPAAAKPYWSVYDARNDILLSQGWETRFGRSRRDYCPDHAKRPGEMWFPGEDT